jgi:hypothetical protein
MPSRQIDHLMKIGDAIAKWPPATFKSTTNVSLAYLMFDTLR